MTIGTELDLVSYSDKLPLQYEESFNLKKFLNIFLAQVQELDKASADFNNSSTSIDIAVGYQLDIIGKLIGADREGRSDEVYRKYIKFKITINTGSGTTEDIIYYLKFVLDSTINVQVFEHYPASVYIHITGVVDSTLSLVSDLEEILPAGTRLGYVSHSEQQRVFIPYTEGSMLTDLIVDTGEFVEDNTGRPLLVRVATQLADARELGILAEIYNDALYTLVTDSADVMTTNTGDILELYTFKETTGATELTLPEVLMS